MKKSEIYILAQYAVIRDESLDTGTKLDIIHTLMSDEDIAEMVEKAEQKKEKAE